MVFHIGNARTNIDRHSIERLSDLENHRREAIEAKLYYLRDNNSLEEFDYVVEAEMRRGELREFGLPAKELIRRMKYRVRNVFKKRDTTPTIYEQLQLDKSCSKSTRAILQKTNNEPAQKQTWETNPQAIAAAMLAY